MDKTKVDEILADIKDHTFRECVKSLDFPRMYDRVTEIDKETDGTCLWLLRHPVYKAWVYDAKPMVCIQGNPGSGKSTLLRYALDNTPATREAVFLSFFFHNGGVELQETRTGFFRSLLHQLLAYARGTLRDMLATFRQRCDTMGKPGKGWEWQPDELKQFFESSLRKVLETRQVWLFVDAVDEADEQTVAYLTVEYKTLSRRLDSPALKQLRSCFTCRHFPPTIDLGKESTISMDKENRPDIERFVRSYIKTFFPPQNRNADLGNFIIEHSQGVFIWARLVLDNIRPLVQRGVSTDNIKAEIEWTDDLTQFYSEIIKDAAEPLATTELMQWICFSTRPLTPDELRWAMAIDPTYADKQLDACQRSKDFITADLAEPRVKSLSCGLAEIVRDGNSHIVRFIHSSVKRFVLDGGLRGLSTTQVSNHQVAPAAHEYLSRSCICYLRMVLFELEHRNKKDIPWFPLLRYAVTAWLVHAKEAHSAETPSGDLLDLLERPLERLSSPFIELWATMYRAMEPFAGDHLPEIIHILPVAAMYGLANLLSCWLVRHKDETNMKVKDKDGQTLLMLAAKNGHAHVVEMLLANGRATINALNETGRKRLPEGGIQINQGDNFNRTALWLASENGHDAVVKLLLEEDDIDVDARDTVFGQTPLMVAVQNGHQAVVRLLLGKSGVGVHATDKLGRTSLSRATEIKLILDLNNNIANTRDRANGQTPLPHSDESRHQRATEPLLHTKQGDIRIKDKAERDSLSWDTEEKDYGEVTDLLSSINKSDLHARNDLHQMILPSAAEQSNKTALELLHKGDNDNPTSFRRKGRKATPEESEPILQTRTMAKPLKEQIDRHPGAMGKFETLAAIGKREDRTRRRKVLSPDR